MSGKSAFASKRVCWTCATIVLAGWQVDFGLAGRARHWTVISMHLGQVGCDGAGAVGGLGVGGVGVMAGPMARAAVVDA